MVSPALKTILSEPIKLTVNDYFELPNDGKRYQIIEGELFVTPAPAPRHQRISGNLHFLLVSALERKGKGKVFSAPIDVILDDQTVVQPDLLFIRTERLHIIGSRNIQGAPDLVIEILSPASRRTDVLIKSAAYAHLGVPHYWIVDPDLDRVEFFRLQENCYQPTTVHSSPEIAYPAEFGDLEIPLSEVFAF